MAYTVTSLNKDTFQNKPYLNSVDLSNKPFTNSNMSLAFYNCRSLHNITNMNTSITNMCETFRDCWNIVDVPAIPSTVTNIYQAYYDCFNLVNAPTIPNGIECIARTFMYCRNLVNVPTLPGSVTNMSGTFFSCSNITDAPTIPNSVTVLSETFTYCSGLINGPASIPDSVITMHRAFESCTHMTNMPTIGESVTNMCSSFYGCYALANFSTLPGSVVNLRTAFSYCRNMVNAPRVPSAAIDMNRTFMGCYNLTGDVYIDATEISDATDCFFGTTLRKNVYIPFTYPNTENTTTYNTFINAGYDNAGTLHNVYLMDNPQYKMYTVTITTEPADATVVLTAPGYTQVGNSITVPEGTNVIYTVSAPGYSAMSGNVWANWDRTKHVVLSPLSCQLIINPTPNDATVVLTATGYTQSGNTITVPYGTTVTYSVSKTNYTTVSGSIVMTDEHKYMDVTLVQNGFTFTVNPTPSDATVLLTASGYTQVGNSIVVSSGTTVSWSVSKSGYITQSGTETITSDTTKNVTLVSGACTLTVIPVPSDATVSITDSTAGTSTSGTGQTTLNTTIGDAITVLVSKSGYTSKTVTLTMTGNATIQVSLEANMSTITFTTNAPNPTIVLSSSGYVQVGNSITVPTGTRVDYIVSATGYVTRQSSIFADGDKTYNIILTEDSNAATITIAPKPSSTSVTIACEGYGSVSGTGTQSLTVPKDSPVTYTVSYGSQTLQVTSGNPLYVSNDILIEYDMTIQHVNHTLTYTETPSSGNHLIGTFMYKSIEGTMVVGPTDASRGTPLFFPKGYQIYLVFHTNNFSHTVGSTATYTTGGGSTYGIRVNKILTVNFSPADAVVTVVDGAGNVIPSLTESTGQNTYYFPYYHSGTTEFYSNTCNITVSRPGYVSQSKTATRNYSSDGSVTINLTPES